MEKIYLKAKPAPKYKEIKISFCNNDYNKIESITILTPYVYCNRIDRDKNEVILIANPHVKTAEIILHPESKYCQEQWVNIDLQDL